MDNSNVATQHFNALHMVNVYTASHRKTFLFLKVIEKY